MRADKLTLAAAAVGGDRVPLGRRDDDPVVADGDVAVDELRARAEAIAGGRARPQGRSTPRRSRAADRSPGSRSRRSAIAVEAADADRPLARLREHDVVARVDGRAGRVRPAHGRPRRRRGSRRRACRRSAPDRYRAVRNVATAGHVDHGKSSLVLALTGTDPDRFAEEKARGLTIDLGFAFTTLPSGTEVGFVDVPGHVRFLKNMLAGVGAVDVVLLVVSAPTTAGCPRARSTSRILELLGVEHGVVALTKADTVDADTLELAQLEVARATRRVRLAVHAPVVVCDSVSGAGSTTSAPRSTALLGARRRPTDHGRPRLWVDRVFARARRGDRRHRHARGWRGRRRRRARDRAHRRARPRPRGSRRRTATSTRRRPASRVALNLAGVDHHAITRGDALVTPGQWARPTVVDVASPFPRPARALAAGPGSRRTSVPASTTSSVRVLDPDGAFAAVALPAPVPARARGPLRAARPGRERTVAGARCSTSLPTGRPRDAAGRLAAAARTRGCSPGMRGCALADVARLAGMGAERRRRRGLARSRPAMAARRRRVAGHDRELDATTATSPSSSEAQHVSSPATPARAGDACASALGARHRPRSEPLVESSTHGSSWSEALVRDVEHVAPIGESPEAAALLARSTPRRSRHPTSTTIGTDPALVRALVARRRPRRHRRDHLHRVGSRPRAQLVHRAARRARHDPVGDARDLLASSRKYVVPLLEHFDREGVTRRRGDVRIAGPNARP